MTLQTRMGLGSPPKAGLDHDPLEDTLEEEPLPVDLWTGWILPRPHRIAVAEDDPDMRRLLVVELAGDGYAVDELEDGQALMAYLRELMDPDADIEPPDLIITDVRMPGMTGLDVLDFLSEVRWSLPVIVITAFGDRQTHELARGLGAVRVLDKPFALADLTTLVFAALVEDAVEGGKDPEDGSR